MIDYVDAMLRTWGIAKRKAQGRQPIRLKDCLFESGNARSFWGRFTEGGHVGRGKSLARLVDPMEGLVGDALVASIAIQLALQSRGLQEKQYELLFLHYVARASTRRKMRAIKMNRQTYWASLHEIHVRLVSWLDAAASNREKINAINDMAAKYGTA